MLNHENFIGYVCRPRFIMTDIMTVSFYFVFDIFVDRFRPVSDVGMGRLQMSRYCLIVSSQHCRKKDNEIFLKSPHFILHQQLLYKSCINTLLKVVNYPKY